MTDRIIGTNQERLNHLIALDRLGFVHERLPSSHPGNGSWFTLLADFDSGRQTPRVRVTIEAGETNVFVFSGHEVDYTLRFSSRTPGEVVNQAVASVVYDDVAHRSASNL